MKRLTVKDLEGSLVRTRDFATQEEAESYVEEKRNTGIFGKPAHPVLKHPAYYDAGGNLLVAAEYETVPDAFTIEITDVTAEYAAKAAVDLAKERRLAGEAIMDKVFATNMAKNLTPEQFQALLQNATLGAVERLLKNGSLTTAKSLIQTMDETFYSVEEKNAIIADIDAALGA